MDTIVAAATPAGGGIAILRISGENALSILQKVFFTRQKIISHKLIYGTLLDAQGAAADRCMAVFMAAPKTYTREDVAELHVHGGEAVLHTALLSCVAHGARLAQPGEFTKRAFLSGRVDLTEAEAVMGMVQATSQMAARASFRALEGEMLREIEQMYAQIEYLLAQISAAVDFPEEDLEAETAIECAETIHTLLNDCTQIIERSHKTQVLRTGVHTVFTGIPNAGKSSLFNALLGFERAIVTPVAGTTRDAVGESVQLGGVAFYLTDTAGIRDTEDFVEGIGVSRARKAIQEADIVVNVIDGSVDLGQQPLYSQDKPCINIINKYDLYEDIRWRDCGFLRVSASTKEGLQQLQQQLLDVLPSETQAPVLANARQIDCMQRTQNALQFALQSAQEFLPPDCIAVDLRDALLSLAELTGKMVDESVIENIFANFCIGK